jgi:hypothetical protein
MKLSHIILSAVLTKGYQILRLLKKRVTRIIIFAAVVSMVASIIWKISSERFTDTRKASLGLYFWEICSLFTFLGLLFFASSESASGCLCFFRDQSRNNNMNTSTDGFYENNERLHSPRQIHPASLRYLDGCWTTSTSKSANGDDCHERLRLRFRESTYLPKLLLTLPI